MKFKLATLAALLAASPAFADNLNGPNPYAAGFGFDTPTEASWGGWNRGDAGTIYAEWDTFSDASYGTSSDRTAAPDVGHSGTTNTYLGWNSGTFPAGSGNLYSFSVTELFNVNVQGSVPSGPVRAVLQIEDWGNDIDLATVMLNGATATSHTVTYTEAAYPSSFGPVALNQHLFIWDMSSAPSTFAFSFASAESSMSLAQVSVDISAAPVPEPETYAMLTAGLGLIGWQVRRRNKAAPTAA